MKKILLGATATALLFAGCAQNELLDGGVATPNDGKIYFSATSGVPTNTRAAAGNPINSTAELQKIGEFFVLGYHGTTKYVKDPISGDAQKVKWTNGVSWEYDNEPYWPSSGTMNFLAYANWDNTPTTIDKDKIETEVTVGTDGDSHKDLLVAATYGATKEIRTLLTFKHALTQIVFKAGNISDASKDDALDVYIGGIRLANISNKGTMKVSDAGNGKAQIAWTGQVDQTTTRRTEYPVSHIDGDLATADGAYEVARIDAADQVKYNKYPQVQTALDPTNNALMLAPQRFTAWDSNSGTKANASGQYGAYIEIDAIIRKKDSENQATWFSGEFVTDLEHSKYGKIYIPVSSLANEIGEWVPGKRINYIITFGDKNSGSGGGAFDENGDPILVPIRFRAVVEDWIETDVPLLTTTFKANSNAITNNFINGYVNQMLADVKDAAAPKVINANIMITGDISSTMNINPDDATALTNGHKYLDYSLAHDQIFSSKFRPGSTVTYDLTGVNDWNSKTVTLKVPAGWEARTYLADAPKNPSSNDLPAIAVGNDAAIEGTIANKIILTKIPTRYTVYNSHINYIEDNIGGLVLNEKALATTFASTIWVSGPVATTTTRFSSDMLAELVGTPNNATLTLNMTGVTGITDAGAETITTWCPMGWKAEVVQTAGNSTTYYPGDPITIDFATAVKTITFTKTDVAAHYYADAVSLKAWLESNITKTTNEKFYYNNVGFDVVIDTRVAPWKDIVNASVVGTVEVILKYPLSASHVIGSTTADGEWTYSAGTVTYVKH